MKWTYLGLATLLQLGLWGLSLATFDSSGIGSLEDLLAVKAAPADVDLSAPLERRQAGGRCGSDGGGAICSGNQCCSAFGYCGDGDSYCPQIVGCQPAFGWCEGEPLPSPSSSSAVPTSTSTSSSTSIAPTSTSSSTNIPTSISTTGTSSTSVSSTPSATSTSPPYTGPLQISQNGMCGNSTTCAGSRFGRCCSQFFYCGNEDSFCGGGCLSQFGACGIAGGVSTVTITSYLTTSVTVSVGAGTPITATMTITHTITSIFSSVVTTTVVGPTIVPTSTSTPVITPTPTAPTPTTTTTSRTTTSSVSTSSVSIPAGLRSSTDGTCGDGVTCLGSSGGQCCSQWGFCGDDRQYCVPLLGCQPEFGRCDSS